ncbi:hypothetical protein [Streptomyces sp. CS014]|uniref:hypothetical protein n=1 Tax=Streptomyces sp. CS014 TaxID=2162707 RepID=UPI000D52520C|nr:hypothetical protein [Streptomyces sp. CS014]PVD04458.1 hypothetical protein DBP12_03265 [Streptomyces sp. CS014]
MTTIPGLPHDLSALTDDELYTWLEALQKHGDRDVLAQGPLALATHLDNRIETRAHLRVLSQAMLDMEAGNTRRVAISTPPQVGKSMLLCWSVLWWMARHPNHRIVLCSYDQGLAIRNARIIRRMVQDHGSRYGLQLAHGSSAVHDWELSSGGGLRSVGIGGGLTGRSANCIDGTMLLTTPSGTTTLARYVDENTDEPVLSYNHATGQAEMKPVTARQLTGHRALVEVFSTSGPSLLCTADHRVHTPSRGWVTAGALRPGDTITGHPGPYVVRFVRPARGLHPVYDLQVEGHANFFANGMLVHNCAFVDDPHKDRAEAESRPCRERVHSWWSSTLLSRLSPKAPTCVVQTRWHEDDLIGRLMQEEGDTASGGAWTYLRMPALCDSPDTDPLGREHGQPLPHPLIPEGATADLQEHWEEKRSRSSIRDWSALYQANPQPAEGALVTEDLLRARRDLQPRTRFQMTAIGVDPSGGGRDVAGVIAAALGTDSRVYWLEDASLVGPVAEWARAAIRLAAGHDATLIVVEGNYGRDMASYALSTAWDSLAREGELPEGMVKPMIRMEFAKKGKRLRAEPIAQALGEDRVRIAAHLPSVEAEWTHWQEGTESPGRIDASVLVTQHLLPQIAGPGQVGYDEDDLEFDPFE